VRRTSRPGLLRPLRERDFRLLWSGQTVSLLGDGVFTVALAWQTLQLSPHASALGLVLFARALPRVLLLLPAGAVSDRVARRWLLLGADLAQGLAVGAIAVLAATGTLRLWHLVVLGALNGAAGAFFLPAATALVPDVLAGELLLAANALNSASRLFAQQLAGPALGGLLVASLGTPWAFGLDAASFGVSVATLALLRPRPQPPRAAGNLVAEIRQGLAYTRAHAWLWGSILVFSAVNFLVAMAFGALLPLLVRDHLHAGAKTLGLVLAAFGAGGGLAAVLAGQFGTPRRRITTLYVSFAVASLLTGGLGLAPTAVVVMALAAGAGLLFEVGNLVWATLLQTLVPARVLGRVAALDWFVSLSLAPVALAVAGPAADAFGVVTVLLAGGLLSATVVVAGLFRPGVRDPDRHPHDSSRT
jgi:MFS family permease